MIGFGKKEQCYRNPKLKKTTFFIYKTIVIYLLGLDDANEGMLQK